MAYSYLVSTVIMGVLLALVVSYVAQRNAQSRWLPAGSAVAEQRGSVTPGQAQPTGGASGLAVVVAVLATILVGIGVSANFAGTVDGVVVFLGLLAGMLAAFAAWGGYHMARVRGFQFAPALAAALWSLGLLVIVAVVIKLLVS